MTKIILCNSCRVVAYAKDKYYLSDIERCKFCGSKFIKLIVLPLSKLSEELIMRGAQMRISEDKKVKASKSSKASKVSNIISEELKK